MTNDQRLHFRLLDFQIGLRLQNLAHLDPVGLLVALRPRRPDRRPARRIQEAELDTHRIRNFAHDAAQCIHFAHQVPLGNPTHRWIAGHLRNQIDVERVERRFQAHACGGHCGFASGMARADHDHIELFGEPHKK